MSTLASLFSPTSIAIVGASHEANKVGHIVAKNMKLQKFVGELYFVNPKGGEIMGQAAALSLEEIKGKIDVAVLCVPAAVSLAVIEANALRIKNFVVLAAGFRETATPEAQANEEKLQSLIKTHNLTVLGPNCVGFINTNCGVNATFLKGPCPGGNIGFISQSGALGSVIVDEFVDARNLGFSTFASIGNKGQLDEVDILQYLVHDPNTTVIGMYLEDVKRGEKFIHELKRATQIKPVVIIKAGSTAAGAAAAVSHTGSLAGDTAVFEAATTQAGAILAANLSEFLGILRVLSFGRAPLSDTFQIITNAGGCGVLATDSLLTHNLQISGEPVDLLGDAQAEDYKTTLESICQSELQAPRGLGGILVLLTPQENTQVEETAKVLIAAQDKSPYPIYPVFMGSEPYHIMKDEFEANKMAAFTNFDELVPILAKLSKLQKLSSSNHHAGQYQILKPASQKLQRGEQVQDSKSKSVTIATGQALNPQASAKVLAAAHIPSLHLHHVVDKDELMLRAKLIGFPIVAKVASDSVVHKTESKGVWANLYTEQALTEAYNYLIKIPGAQGCFLQKQIKGSEIFVGAKRDHDFGIVILVGLGGIYAELLTEVVSFVWPVSEEEFAQKLMGTKVAKLMNGFRGGPIVRVTELYHLCQKLGKLMTHARISEVDLNPVVATNKSELTIIDPRVVLKTS